MFVLAVLSAALALVAAMVTIRPAAAASNLYQRGPDPTLASVAATNGPFATASISVAPGNGFNGGTIYYPTDTSQGTWGALAIVPGYTALFANEEAWMGPRLASFGFVVIGIETNSRTDYDVARGTELLAALDYLTTQSPVRNLVDPNRLGVIGHSMGGGGVVYATEHRSSLKAAVALAPFSPSQNMSTDHVPTMVMGGRNDTVVTPSYLDGLYGTMPAATQSDFVQIAGADHVYYTHPNSVEMRLLIPWVKIFLDDDTRYTQFLCPTLADSTGVSIYHSKCPYVPAGGPPPPPSSSSASSQPSTPPSTPPSSPSSGSSCKVTDTVNAWNNGATEQITIANTGGTTVNGWSLKFTLPAGQTITSAWNATVTPSSGAVAATNLSYNASIPAGGNTGFGFQISHTGDSAAPASFTLNGVACSTG
jgi:dienelactone hydrolase